VRLRAGRELRGGAAVLRTGRAFPFIFVFVLDFVLVLVFVQEGEPVDEDKDKDKDEDEVEDEVRVPRFYRSLLITAPFAAFVTRCA
jgi:hypothetical protein